MSARELDAQPDVGTLERTVDEDREVLARDVDLLVHRVGDRARRLAAIAGAAGVVAAGLMTVLLVRRRGGGAR